MEPKTSKQPAVDRKKLKFLIATDVHLGHAENHQQLGNDSYNAFEEVLQTAKKQDVDFLLLGGDLFDQVNPTQKCIYKCLNLLKDNIFGDRQLSIGVKGIKPNFSNHNLNISLPIFTIHGNHDYPSNDFGKISVCDLLSASNYVNYFGKHLNIVDQGQKKILIKPIIFQKEGVSSKLAIYGLGYIKDLKLHRMFQEKAITFQQPQKKSETICIFIFHQNRFKGKKGGVGASYQNCIHPSQLPKWLDLVIWCHQHQAIYQPTTQSDLLVYQPGSTVITSYIEAESFKKQCVLITISEDKKFQITSILLQKSYRPMYTKFYFLLQIIDQNKNKQNFNLDEFFSNQIQQILKQNKQQNPSKKPIIRMKIDYTNHQIIRLIRVQQKYRQAVANGNKIFTYSQKRQPKKNLPLEDKQVLEMIKNNKVQRDITKQKQIAHQLIQIFMEQTKPFKLSFFDQAGLKETITQFMNSDEKGIISQLKHTYARELQKKQSEQIKRINNFQMEGRKQFALIHQQLLKSSRINQVPKQPVNLRQIRYDTERLKNEYLNKQKQIESMHEGDGKKINKQTQPQSKSTVKASHEKSRNSVDSYNRDSESQGKGSMRLSNSSDEEDCCVRAEKDPYRENDTRMKFQQAQKQIQKKKKQLKAKKNVKFKDQ